MSKQEVAKLILAEIQPGKSVEFFVVRSFTELPTEGNNRSVIGMHCNNAEEEREQIYGFLKEIFAKEHLEVSFLKTGDCLEGLSIAQ